MLERLSVTDFTRERIPSLWSTVREWALAKGFSFKIGDAKYAWVYRTTAVSTHALTQTHGTHRHRHTHTGTHTHTCDNTDHTLSDTHTYTHTRRTQATAAAETQCLPTAGSGSVLRLQFPSLSVGYSCLSTLIKAVHTIVWPPVWAVCVSFLISHDWH